MDDPPEPRGPSRGGPNARAGLLLAAAALVSGCGDGGVEPWSPDASTPPRVPSGCCGCLCQDAQWSCSDNVCLDVDGRVLELQPEAGFLEIDARSVVVAGWEDRTPRHRVWYSFQPARPEAGPDAPLLVFFNGGPGSATLVLFGGDTGEHTLNTPDLTGAAENPTPWTELGHLLYIDPPWAGFSYVLPADDSTPSTFETAETDAATVLLVLLRFLERHPQLDAAPIVLVGESYGGARATLMLLLARTEIAPGPLHALYEDPVLVAASRRHHRRVSSRFASSAREGELAHLGTAVLIQPLVGGIDTYLVPSDSPLCIEGGSHHDCARTSVEQDALTASFAERMGDPALLEIMLGVDPLSIAWLHPAAREGAYGRASDEADPLANVLGPLPSTDDAYYLASNLPVGASWPYYAFSAVDHLSPAFADYFLDVVRRADVFVTDAALDGTIDTPSLVSVLGARPAIAEAALHLDTPAEAVRPGILALRFVDGRERSIRMPHYAEAGHAVTLRQSGALLADVTRWYRRLH